MIDELIESRSIEEIIQDDEYLYSVDYFRSVDFVERVASRNGFGLYFYDRQSDQPVLPSELKDNYLDIMLERKGQLEKIISDNDEFCEKFGRYMIPKSLYKRAIAEMIVIHREIAVE